MGLDTESADLMNDYPLMLLRCNLHKYTFYKSFHVQNILKTESHIHTIFIRQIQHSETAIVSRTKAPSRRLTAV